jgi:hypothetical protein
VTPCSRYHHLPGSLFFSSFPSLLLSFSFPFFSFIMSQTEAQAEFQQLVDKNSQGPEEDRHLHPEDRLAYKQEATSAGLDDLDEEEQYRAEQIDAAMRMPSLNQSAAGADAYGYKLPPASFDSGRATGVKGVIADARNYELARKATFMSRVRNARRSVFGLGHVSNGSVDHDKKSDLSSEEDEDEESFLAQWRESRRRELEDDTRPGAHIRTRRTSPSVRIYGRLDTVDALGYLDAIEKVGRETVVVVFVFDDEVCHDVTPHHSFSVTTPNTDANYLPVPSIQRCRARSAAFGVGVPHRPLCQGPLR